MLGLLPRPDFAWAPPTSCSWRVPWYLFDVGRLAAEVADGWCEPHSFHSKTQLSRKERGHKTRTARRARTSKRTFYEQFASKEECLIELLRRNNAYLITNIQAAVDPEAEWQHQIRQSGPSAYVDHIGSRPAVTLER